MKRNYRAVKLLCPRFVGRAELWARARARAASPFDQKWHLLRGGGNLILNGMRSQQVRAIAGVGAAASYVLSHIVLGTDGTAEAVDDAAITGPVPVAVSATTYPTQTSLRVEALLDSATANGVVFQEMGLRMANGILVARKAFPAITKSSLFEWLMRWTISVATPVPAGGATVTLLGIEHLLKLLANDDVTNRPVNRMQFGTGSDAAVPADMVLQTPITPVKDIVDRTEGAYSVLLRAFLLAGEGNGFPIAETGLLAPNGGLIARATFAEQAKDSDHILGFSWLLESL